MATFISRSPEETLSLGEQWGRDAEPGWVIGLSGELGAGKTQLVKGFARGLGVSERVRSPTFALVNEYTTGRLPLFHLDLYRLETLEQIRSAGLEEFLQPHAVAIVEWAERWYGEFGDREASANPFPARFRWAWIESLSEMERRITYEDFGA